MSVLFSFLYNLDDNLPIAHCKSRSKSSKLHQKEEHGCYGTTTTSYEIWRTNSDFSSLIRNNNVLPQQIYLVILFFLREA